MKSKPTPETRGIVLGRDMFRCVRCGRGTEFCAFSIHHRWGKCYLWDDCTIGNEPEPEE